MDLKEIIWGLLEPTDEEGKRYASDELVTDLYHQGFADTKRVGFLQWRGIFQRFPRHQQGFVLARGQLESLKPFLYPAAIKKPFDPYHLKDGGRPLAWLEELYQKVLHFETTLTLPEWKKIVSQKIEPHFKRGDKLLLNKELKDVIFNLLTQKPSPLRRLEIFCLQAPPSEPGVEKTEESKAPSPPVLIKDSFVAKPEEIQKKAAMDKLFYHYEQQPKGDDAANLNFLDELANREEEGEDEDPSS